MVDIEGRIALNLKSSGCAPIYGSISALTGILRFLDSEYVEFIGIVIVCDLETS